MLFRSLHTSPKPLTIDTIAIAQEVAWSRVEGESFHDLLSSPFRSRMVRRVEVNDLSAFMTQNDKYIQDSEGRRGNGGRRSGEEVYRYQLRYMITKETASSLRRRLPTADHVFGDRGFGHTNAKLSWLATIASCWRKASISRWSETRLRRRSARVASRGTSIVFIAETLLGRRLKSQQNQ